jgi:dipeptidase E
MYRLALYGDQNIPANRSIDLALLELLGTPWPRVGYISSSNDLERRYFLPKQSYYAQYGIDLCVYVELDEAFDETLLDRLFSCNAIHLSGGNTFYFLYWLQQRGLGGRLYQYAKSGGTLIGVSAGAILMTPYIDAALLCGDVPYALLTDVSGLSLTSFGFVPHLLDTPEQDQDIQAYSDRRNMILYGCHDGDGIIVDGQNVRFFGNTKTYNPRNRHFQRGRGESSDKQP